MKGEQLNHPMPCNLDKEKAESAIRILERCEYFRTLSEEIERSSEIFSTSTDSCESSGTIESHLLNQNRDSVLRRFSDAAHSDGGTRPASV